MQAVDHGKRSDQAARQEPTPRRGQIRPAQARLIFGTEQQVGDYKLGVVLGRGGMGEVYEAAHVETGQPAALKLLYPHLLSDPGHWPPWAPAAARRL